MAEDKDLEYQSQTEKHVFAADSPEKKKIDQRTIVVSFTAEILGLLLLFAVFLLILNYFKVISLNSLLSKPASITSTTPPSTSTNQKSLTPTPSFTSVDTSAITTQDSASNINLYKTYSVPAPHYSAQDASWMAGGVFAGYGKNSIMIISSDNTLVFNLNAKTVFEEVIINNLQGSSSTTMGFNPYSDFNSFMKAVAFGKYVQIYYNQDQSGSNKTTTQVYYIPSYKL